MCQGRIWSAISRYSGCKQSTPRRFKLKAGTMHNSVKQCIIKWESNTTSRCTTSQDSKCSKSFHKYSRRTLPNSRTGWASRAWRQGRSNSSCWQWARLAKCQCASTSTTTGTCRAQATAIRRWRWMSSRWRIRSGCLTMTGLSLGRSRLVSCWLDFF